MAERWLAELIGICPMKESISSSSFVWIRFYYFFLYHFFLGLDWIGSNRLWFKIDSIIDDQNTSIKIGFMGKGELVEWNVNFRGAQCNNKKDIFTFEFSPPPHTFLFFDTFFSFLIYICEAWSTEEKKRINGFQFNSNSTNSWAAEVAVTATVATSPLSEIRKEESESSSIAILFDWIETNHFVFLKAEKGKWVGGEGRKLNRNQRFSNGCSFPSSDSI